jgi:uncharacterized lipoprotein
MRSGLLVIALAACSSSSAAARPTWPKQTAHDSDGGESLAPRAQARSVAAADDDDRPAAPSTPAAADRQVDRPGPSAGQSIDRVAPAASTPSPDEPVQTEDIVIEIDD